MIARNGSSALTEVHFDGKSEKQVFVGNQIVWPTIDWNKYSFRVIAYPDSNNFDYTASNNVDGITGMVIQDSHLGDFTEIKPTTKISVADMKYINYLVSRDKGGGPLYIGYAGNYISANMFYRTQSTEYNYIHNSILHIFKDLDYIGDNALNGGIVNVTFFNTVTKIPTLSPTALPKNFLEHGYIYVPKSLEEAFKNADVWKNYADRINVN